MTLLVACHGHPSLDVGQARIDSAEFAHEILGEFLAGAFSWRFKMIGITLDPEAYSAETERVKAEQATQATSD